MAMSASPSPSTNARTCGSLLMLMSHAQYLAQTSSECTHYLLISTTTTFLTCNTWQPPRAPQRPRVHPTELHQHAKQQFHAHPARLPRHHHTLGTPTTIQAWCAPPHSHYRCPSACACMPFATQQTGSHQGQFCTMEDLGIICRSASPWSSPLHLVPKSLGGH